MDSEVVVVLFFMVLVTISIIAILGVTIKNALRQGSTVGGKSVSKASKTTSQETKEIIKEDRCLMLGSDDVYLNNINPNGFNLKIGSNVYINLSSSGECPEYSLCLYIESGNLFISHWNSSKNDFVLDDIIPLTNKTAKIIINKCDINISLGLNQGNTTTTKTAPTKKAPNIIPPPAPAPPPGPPVVFDCVHCTGGPCMLYCRHMRMMGMFMKKCRNMDGSAVSNIYKLNNYILLYSKTNFLNPNNIIAYKFTNINPRLNGKPGCIVIDTKNYKNISVYIWNGKSFKKAKYKIKGPLKNPLMYNILFPNAYLVNVTS